MGWRDLDLIDPMCGRKPPEIDGYTYMLSYEDGSDMYPLQTREEAAYRYVWENEGTLNTENGHFLCDDCYIKAGMPANPWPEPGWKCP